METVTSPSQSLLRFELTQGKIACARRNFLPRRTPMTWRDNKTKLPKMPVPKQRKNGSRRYIDPNDFYLMRRRAFLTVEQASELLDVTRRTIINWEKGKSRIPYTAFRVLKIKVGYVFDDEFFEDWFVRGDTLWSPEGRGFKPHELRYISNYFWMARQWLAERKAGKLQTPPAFTIPAGAASDDSPAPSCGAAPRHSVIACPGRMLRLVCRKNPRPF